MKSSRRAITRALCVLAASCCVATRAEPLVTAITNVQMVPMLTITSTIGHTNQLSWSANGEAPWTPLANLLVTQTPYLFYDTNAASSPFWNGETSTVPKRFYGIEQGVYRPQLSQPQDVSILENVAWSINLTLADAYLQPASLAFLLVNGPEGLTVSSEGKVSWTPTEAQGPMDPTVVVGLTNNGTGLYDTKSFVVHVLEANTKPIIRVPGNQTIVAGTRWITDVTATDQDRPANTLVFSKTAGPVTITQSSATSCVLNWTPTEADVRAEPYTVTIRVTDNGMQAGNAYPLFDEANFQITVVTASPAEAMVQIPEGGFRMGDAMDNYGAKDEWLHTLTNISAFKMDINLVSFTLWREVFNYAIAHNYKFDGAGSAKGTNHPVQFVTWYDAVKWCNARSEKEGKQPCYYISTDWSNTSVYRSNQVDLLNTWVNWDANGYRLPTEAEWEKAARGNVAGHRFPWSDKDTIDHAKANYMSENVAIRPIFDVGYAGYDARYKVLPYPFTSPVGSFPANGYGLYDMAGNVRQWCWDWYKSTYYKEGPSINPHGPATKTSSRVTRGGAWCDNAVFARCSDRDSFGPSIYSNHTGFRCVRRD